ncbi:phosphoketolase family protein [Candidatus Saccharibacteria bacterium]|nr:phosphoketolase family protein [Candidatus Saccharibacteria bacterium]
MRAVGDVQLEIDVSDYLSVAQVYLQDNFDLSRPLETKDIKPRLLGHWGTCHGISAARANLRDFEGVFAERLGIKDFRYVVGVGHGYAAVQADLWLDGTLDAYSKHPISLETLCKQFSWPHGYPSHTNPLTPRTILEGGELGYSLGVAYGAALDAPERLCAVLIGDGEMETGSILASMNLNKLLNMRDNGIVLPILHLNGYKISGPTVYARISDKELSDLISGFGYQPLFVDGDNVEEWRVALDKCVKIWYNERYNGGGAVLRMPFIVMKTPKGEGVPDAPNGQKIAGTARSHQVPFSHAKTDPADLASLEKWLKSYKFTRAKCEKLRKQLARFRKEQSANVSAPPLSSMEQALAPPSSVASALGEGTSPSCCSLIHSQQFTPHTSATDAGCAVACDLTMGCWSNRVGEVYEIGQEKFSSAKRIGEWMQAHSAENPKSVRLFSPDETSSNKLDAIYASTRRAWQREILPTDENLAPNGRVVELLSENALFALAMGYSITGRKGFLTSYEAFIPIIASQAAQYMKFIMGATAENAPVSEEVMPLALARARRATFPAITILSTSVGWRQDHNGYSHQNPGFISELLVKPSKKANCYFPIDDVAAIAAMDDAFAQRNMLNLVTYDKNENPRWIDSSHAEFQLKNGGLSIFEFASNPMPEIICAGCGDIVSREMLYAMQLVREYFPKMPLRFVGIGALSHGAFGTVERPANQALFDDYFGKQTPVVAAFHGYAETLWSVFARYTNPRRVLLRGYEEKGSTTSPLDMLMLNRISRYDLAIDILKVAITFGIVDREVAAAAARDLLRELKSAGEYIIKHGEDREKDQKWRYKIQS